MWNIFKVKRAAATLPLLIFSVFYPSLCTAQAAKLDLDTYIAQSVREAGTLYGVTIAEWSAHHPGEVVQAPEDSGRDDLNKAYELSPRQQNDWRLDGR